MTSENNAEAAGAGNSTGPTSVPPEQAQTAMEAKQDEKTESTASSVEGLNNNHVMEKRKRDTRRFPRLFRATSPKKARFERRRSTGSDHNLTSTTTAGACEDPPPVPHTVSRSLPFLRRNASLDTENRAVIRKRSLFRRGRNAQQQQQQRETSPTPAVVQKKSSSSSAEEEESTPWFEQTRVITVRNNSPEREQEEKKEEDGELAKQPGTVTDALCISTEIFQHSYLETLCGVRREHTDEASVYDEEPAQRRPRLPDDPTVQESIECVFSTQLEEDISRMLQLDDDESEKDDEVMVDEVPLAPSQIQQSVLRTRSDISRTTPPQGRSRKRVESLKLAHVGSFRSGMAAEPPLVATSSSSTGTYSCCACKCQSKPQIHPSAWPQAPLLLRPTPGRGMRVHRIRLVRNNDEDSVLWEAGQTDKHTWAEALKKYWGMDEHAAVDLADYPMCPECIIMPINNGNEEAGESLVTDFESDLFVGTFMLRLRHCNGTTRAPYQDDRGYFTGMNRRYQAVVRGRFKKELQWTKCKTGFVLDRRAGKLPAKWILKGGVKVLSFFAPHLEVKFDGPRPMSMTPLGSTPQVLAVHNPDEPYDMEGMQEEPTTREHTLLGEVSTASSSLQRARLRKKSFDKLYSHQSATPKTDPSKVYTFEFLQHLFNFQDFSIELGSMLGSVPLAPIVDGQALPIMATYEDFDQRLWSFDVWHHSLVTGNSK